MQDKSRGVETIPESFLAASKERQAIDTHIGFANGMVVRGSSKPGDGWLVVNMAGAAGFATNEGAVKSQSTRFKMRPKSRFIGGAGQFQNTLGCCVGKVGARGDSLIGDLGLRRGLAPHAEDGRDHQRKLAARPHA